VARAELRCPGQEQTIKDRHDVDLPLEQVAGNMQIVYDCERKD
jgi:hypothetical protein